MQLFFLKMGQRVFGTFCIFNRIANSNTKNITMKSLKIFSLATALMFFSVSVMAQETTETFKVSGNCGMCKTKIEKAAKEAGAKEASWDKDTKQLTVTYKAKSTNAAKIQQKIAEVGYDNVGFKATNEAYDKLHGCCKYEREPQVMEPNSGEKMDCCKDGKCSKEGHDGKECCSKEGKGEGKHEGGCSKEGQGGKSCCSKKN